jgi:hypothetical protein
MFPDKDDITWGGFIKSNIKRGLIEDCLSSGDPVNMFRAIEDEIGVIRDEIDEMGGYEYWEREMEDWSHE